MLDSLASLSAQDRLRFQRESNVGLCIFALRISKAKEFSKEFSKEFFNDEKQANA
jgi:hypothetical protein